MTLSSNCVSTFGEWYMHSVWAYKLCCGPKPFQPLISHIRKLHYFSVLRATKGWAGPALE